MTTQELLLKTAFCCMACDGDIANEEIDLLKKHINETNLFVDLNVEEIINRYVSAINEQGTQFLFSYLSELSANNISDSDALQIIKLAIKMIEADNQMQYSEISFFKRIRSNLSISDEAILAVLPDKEDYLLPDIMEDESYEWNVSFNNITLDSNTFSSLPTVDSKG